VHTRDYVDAVRVASLDPSLADTGHGLGTEDVPAFAGMHEASARIAQGSLETALAVWRREAEHGVNFCGGMHHAMPSAASGFCVYNDIGVAIAGLLAEGVERVVYIDVDVHHGDGVQAMFWNDPRVLTISIHETGRALFPGTGYPHDIGGPDAEGYAVNVSLPPGTADAAWLRSFHSVVPAMLGAFRPQMIVSQHGCDSHLQDPLAHLALTVDAQAASYAAVHKWAHEFCDGRWLAVGGGGYEVVDVVPRAWSHLVGIAAHRPVDTATGTPQSWRDYVLSRCGRGAPLRMSDGGSGDFQSWSAGYDPGDVNDRAVMATRKAIFPLHGLDPYFD
jgi:acetoin utilization protein AcuC